VITINLPGFEKFATAQTPQWWVYSAVVATMDELRCGPVEVQ